MEIARTYPLSVYQITITYTIQTEWEIRDGGISSEAQFSSELFIADSVTEDSGEYRCIISNSTGTIASDYKRIVIQGFVNNLCTFIAKLLCIP